MNGGTMNKVTTYALTAIVLGLIANGAHAGVWTELGDAGDVVGTHQTPTGSGALTAIFGDLGNSQSFFTDVDMYCIFIDDPTTFSATVAFAGGSTSEAPVPPLWLFDPNGNGVTSQEGFYLNTPTQITGSFISSAGKYYLAISPHDTVPYTITFLDIWSAAPRSVETPPNGSAVGPVDNWSPFGAQFGTGSYAINLTGASYCCDVPEPGTLSLFITGLMIVRLNQRGKAGRATALSLPDIERTL
jgi:hypothetical protein